MINLRRRVMVNISEGIVIPEDAVDLGLPSGTLWCSHNVGANNSYNYGNYYMFGMGSKTYNKNDNPYVVRDKPLPAAYDTATQVMGEPWRMPTNTEIEELVNNTTKTVVTVSGIKCFRFTGSNGNYVEFPAGGRYESGSLNEVGGAAYLWSSMQSGNKYGATRLGIDSNNNYIGGGDSGNGMNVRGVCNFSS